MRKLRQIGVCFSVQSKECRGFFSYVKVKICALSTLVYEKYLAELARHDVRTNMIELMKCRKFIFQEEGPHPLSVCKMCECLLLRF